jgi:hypothetical protein
MGKESSIDEYTRKERMGITWLKVMVWKARRDQERICERKVNPVYMWATKHILLKCSETKIGEKNSYAINGWTQMRT